MSGSLPIEASGEAVEREGGARGHGEDVPVARVHDDHGARVSRHRPLRRFLNAPVHRGDDLVAGVGLVPPHDLHGAPKGVHLDALAAVATAQVLVEHPLESALADHVAAAVAPLLHLLVAHLPDVAEEVRGERARGVDALRLDLDNDTGQLELALLDLGDFLERESAPHAHGAERVGRDALERLLELAHGDFEQHRQPRQDGVAVIHLPRDERQGEGRAVVHEGEAVPVEEDAARRRHGTDPDTVLLRHLLELAAFEHLQVPELAHQPDECDGDHGGQRDDATAPRLPSRGRFVDQIHVCLLLNVRTASMASTQAAPANPL